MTALVTLSTYVHTAGQHLGTKDYIIIIQLLLLLLLYYTIFCKFSPLSPKQI